MKTLFLRPAIVLAAIFLLFTYSCSQKEKTYPVKKDIIDAVFASGYIIDSNEYLLTAGTDAYLNKSMVKEGNHVHQGMPLFELSNEVQSAQYETALSNYTDARDRNDANSPQVTQLKLQIEQAKLTRSTDEANYRRYANLVKTRAVSQSEYEKATLQFESSKRNLSILEQSLSDLQNILALNEKNASYQLSIQKRNNKDFILTSNFNGIVMFVYKNQGEYVRRGETIAKIGGGNPIIKLSVAEEDIKQIRVNNKVIVSLNTDKQKTFNARISKIYPAFDDKEQSFILEAVFDQMPENLFYNTQLQANIIVNEKRNALVIPAKFLAGGDTVQLANGNRTVITKGISNNDWVEVLRGVTEKDEIVYTNTRK